MICSLLDKISIATVHVKKFPKLKTKLYAPNFKYIVEELTKLDCDFNDEKLMKLMLEQKEIAVFSQFIYDFLDKNEVNKSIKAVAKSEALGLKLIIRFKKSTKYLHFEDSEKVHEYGHDDTSYILNLEDDEEVRLSDLYKIIAQLPDGYRMVFNLYAIEGYSHNDIAKELKISTGTSKSQLARARMMLKKLVKEQLNIG